MCGFVAMRSAREPVAAETLQAAVAVLRHRGPDARGLWIAPDRSAGLAHARLAIIDLETGDQPIGNEDGSIQIAVNGEFYGFEAIRAELEQRGHRFRTRSDSEIAVHLYEERGPSCLARLRGEFSFALWDHGQRALLAARDRFGTRPLYYAFHRGALYLASEIKAILAAGVPARWNLEHVFDAATVHTLFNISGAAGTSTLFDGIHQVPPGHYLLSTPSAPLKLVPYWEPRYADTERGHDAPPFEEAAAMVRDRLDEAVELRLRADVPVACYVSHGIDSAAVLALAARRSSRPVTAFTMTFDVPEYDESAGAMEIARSVGAEFVPIPVDHRRMGDVFEDAVWHAETYLWNTNAMAKLLLSEGVHRAGYKVVLSGQGSDEIFAGYGFFRQDMAGSGAPPAASGSLDPMARVSGAVGFAPSFLGAAARSGRTIAALLGEPFERRFAGRDASGMLVASLPVDRVLRGADRVSRSMYLWNRTALTDFVLSVVGDRPEMAHSVESRLPYLDHELVELVDALPTGFKIRDRVEKAVLREALIGLLPDEVRLRPKKPFLSPPASYDPGTQLYRCIRDTVTSSLPDFFDRRKVEAYVARVPPVEPGVFRVYDNEADRQILESDLCLMFIASLSILGRRFHMSAA
jgi:asparagine synthase (glutamine-hydrolysing)